MTEGPTGVTELETGIGLLGMEERHQDSGLHHEGLLIYIDPILTKRNQTTDGVSLYKVFTSPSDVLLGGDRRSHDDDRRHSKPGTPKYDSISMAASKDDEEPEEGESVLQFLIHLLALIPLYH